MLTTTTLIDRHDLGVNSQSHRQFCYTSGLFLRTQIWCVMTWSMPYDCARNTTTRKSVCTSMAQWDCMRRPWTWRYRLDKFINDFGFKTVIAGSFENHSQHYSLYWWQFPDLLLQHFPPVVLVNRIPVKNENSLSVPCYYGRMKSMKSGCSLKKRNLLIYLALDLESVWWQVFRENHQTLCLFSWQVDVDLAKQNADKPEDDEELRKKLWLKIGRY